MDGFTASFGAHPGRRAQSALVTLFIVEYQEHSHPVGAGSDRSATQG